MKNSLLIQNLRGVETPTIGRWAIARSRATIIPGRSALHRAPVAEATVCGALVVGEEPAPPRLTLAITSDAVPTGTGPSTLLFFASSIPTRIGQWLVQAPTLSAENDGPQFHVVDASLRYHGVFTRGERAVAWLELYVRAAVQQRGGERRRSRRMLEFRADLNADAPRSGG